MIRSANCPGCHKKTNFEIGTVDSGLNLKWENSSQVVIMDIPFHNQHVYQSVGRPLSEETVRDFYEEHLLYRCTDCGRIFPLPKGIKDADINKALQLAKKELTDSF